MDGLKCNASFWSEVVMEADENEMCDAKMVGIDRQVGTMLGSFGVLNDLAMRKELECRRQRGGF